MNSPIIAYHAAETCDIDSILEHGLIPSPDGPCASNWFYLSAEHAVWYVGTPRYLGRAVVIRADLTGLDLIHETEDRDGPVPTVRTTAVVTPDRLTVV